MNQIIHNNKFINILFYFSIVYIIWSLTYKFGLDSWWQLLVTFFAILTLVYGAFKKFSTTEEIDSFPKKFFNTKPLTKIFFSLAFITLATFLLLFPFKTAPVEKTFNDRFGGIIWDEVSEPLPQVVVFLPELNLVDTTDNQGKFSFLISDTTLTTISFIAQKTGYKTYEAEGSIGNRYYNFNMIKK